VTLVPTTAGDCEAGALGVTLCHEHVTGGYEGMRVQWPHLYDPDAEMVQIARNIEALQKWGVATIVDPSCLDLNRNAHLSLAVTESTGMRFVLATGVYGVAYRHFGAHIKPSANVLVDCFLHDLEEGIQGSGVRAAFLKCACDRPGLTRDIEMVHRAVAQASLKSGAPIMAHSNPKFATGLEQMSLFHAEGVTPSKIQMAHTGDTDDLDYIERLLETGCFVGLDRFGLDVFLSTERRLATLAALVERGHGERLMLSQDCCFVLDGMDDATRRAFAPDWRPTFLFETVLPAARRLGVPQDQLAAMVGSNVHAWLSA